MADISYTAIGAYDDNHIVLGIALSDTENNEFRIIEKYDLSSEVDGVIYNAILLHVDNGTISPITATKRSFITSFSLECLNNSESRLGFNSSLGETLLFVAHEFGALTLDLNDLKSRFHVLRNRASQGSYNYEYESTENSKFLRPPRKLGVSIIVK
ncbi:MAG: hypothetical protein ACOVLC_11275 [Flavobacterium sp.]